MIARLLMITAGVLIHTTLAVSADPDSATSEPEYLPVEDLIATSSLVFIALAPEDPGGELTGRGYPVVAVRGVAPYRQQLQAFIKATGFEPEVAATALEAIDFSLERQRRLAEDRWSAWEAVDTQRFREVLSGAASLDPEPVAPALCVSAMTCPLPWRLTGQWRSQAIHPRLASFLLTDDEIEQEQAFQEALALAEVGQAAPNVAARRILQFVPEIWQDVITIDWILQRLTATADHRLFRYLDFDVAPGVTYRYRLRLELRNPVRGHAVRTADNLVEISQGETRLTPWSEPSDAATVEELTQVFAVGHTPPRVRLFQYEPGLGTTVAGELGLAPGQRIEGAATVPVINGINGQLSIEEYRFQTEAELVDSVAVPELSPEHHPDLQRIASHLGSGAQEGWLIIHRSQQLQAMEVDSDSAGLQEHERLQELQRQYFGIEPR
jgi:hypothetical protein